MNWLVLLPFAIFFVWLLVTSVLQRKLCPSCSQSLPLLQSPLTKTKRQWVEGGYVCENCGCETDFAGARVEPGTVPSTRSIVIGASLIAIAALPAIAMICILIVR